MLRTVFAIGLFALLGLVALRFFFGILPMLVGLLLWVLGLAIKIAILGLIIYFVIRIFSPDTARKLREKWSGTAM